MTAQVEAKSTHRFPALDSLRGIAAVSVVTYHLLDAMPNLPWRLFHRTPLVALLMGPEAVLLFFVLSGFVLTLQLSKDVSYFQYVAHRICRIYIPYISAIFVAAICMFAIPHGAVPWLTKVALQGLWRKPADFAMIAPATAFIYPSTKLMKFDPVVWSLVYEMRISLIFPLLLLALRRLGTAPVLLGGAAVSALTCITVMPVADDYVKKAIVTSAWLPTLHYIFLFICGAAIAIHRNEIVSFLSEKRLRLSIFVASVVLYLEPEILLHRVLHLPFGMLTHDWAITSAVCGIICCAIGPFEIAQFLELPALRYLGKVSYSLYLTHLIIFLTVMHALGSHSTYLLSAGATIVLCIPVAHLMYHGVEAPSIRLARSIAKIIRDSEDNRAGRRLAKSPDTLAG